jgi:signal peptidase I
MKEKIRQWGKGIWEFSKDTLWSFFSILFVVIFIRTFLVTPFNVSGVSMNSTLEDYDFILIDKLSYRVSEPSFQDIIVFIPPNPRKREASGITCLIHKLSQFDFSSSCLLPDYFIKRIIGLPGDTIRISGGEVYRNDELLDESVYLNTINNHATFVPGESEAEFIVPENQYFVLGDNRGSSSDSRSYSPQWKDPETSEYDPFVKKSDIEGRYLLTVFNLRGILGTIHGGQ